MLKHLYKTLLISVISGSLLTLQTTTAFAAATETQGTVTTDDKGVITATKNYQFEKISDQDMLTSITMLAGGFITGRMLASYRPLTTDVMIAGAGGVAFIAGEVISNVKFKGTIDEMTVEVQKKSDGTVNEAQIQRLQDLKKSYEEAKKTTKTKKTLQLAAAAAFGAAALTAGYYAMTETSTAGLCKATINLAKTALGTCSASGSVANPEAPGCGVCLAKIQAYEAAFLKYTTSRPVPASSLTKGAAMTPDETFLSTPTNFCFGQVGATVGGVAAKMQTSCGGAMGVHIKNQVEANIADLTKGFTSHEGLINKYLGGSAGLISYDQFQSREPSYFEKGLDLLFPRAEAGWLPLLGLGASTAASFFLITGTTAMELDLMMFVPANRAIAFGVLAGLAYMASRSSDNVIKKIDENISKIDTILADLAKLAKGVKAQNLATQTIDMKTIKPGSNTYSPYSTSGNAKTPCMTSNSSANCEALSSKLTNMPGFANLPESLKNIANQSVGLADQLSGSSGVSGSTISSAESLGNKQNAISKALKAQNEKLSKIAGAKNSPSKKEEKLLNGMRARVRSALQKNGMTATGFMGSVGATPIDSSLAKNAAEEGAGGKSEALAQDLLAGGPAPEKDESLKLDFKEDSPALGLADSSGGSSSSGDQYDVKTDEIAGDNGPSIFELISRRYIKSGYPKLLEEEPTKN